MKKIIRPLTSSEINGFKSSDLAQFIDHTLLRANAKVSEFKTLCNEAQSYSFYSVCVNSSRIVYVANELRNTDVKICSVIGFPLGAMSSESKAFEAKTAVDQGADEIDMVLNIGALKEKNFSFVREDIEMVRLTIPGVVLKVIIETCLLNDDEKRIACKLAVEAGADFVKTSTGFSTGGATVEDIALMREVVGVSIGVKASGGIRTADDALSMLHAGATRIGSGNGVAVITSTILSGNK